MGAWKENAQRNTRSIPDAKPYVSLRRHSFIGVASKEADETRGLTNHTTRQHGRILSLCRYRMTDADKAYQIPNQELTAFSLLPARPSSLLPALLTLRKRDLNYHVAALHHKHQTQNQFIIGNFSVGFYIYSHNKIHKATQV